MAVASFDGTVITRRYRELATIVHPDKWDGPGTAFVRLKDAYDELMRPDRAGTYQRRATQAEAPFVFSCRPVLRFPMSASDRGFALASHVMDVA